jgi:phage/plasmid-like protein (TIGR03299 family)
MTDKPQQMVDPSDSWLGPQQQQEELQRAREEAWDKAEVFGTIQGAREFEFGVTGSGRPAWHGETVVHEGEMYADDVLERYGFDFEVVKRPMYVPPLDQDIHTRYGERHHRYNTENLIEVPDQFAMVRTSDNKVLGTVGNVYEPVQNREAFAFINSLVENSRVVIEAAVSLRGGKLIMITARRPENVLIAGEEVVPYLNFANGHDGKIPIVMMASPVRGVCMNTFRLAIKEAVSNYRIRHTRTALHKLQRAREALDISFKPSELDAELADVAAELRREGDRALDVAENYTERFQQIGNDLASFKMNNRQFENFIKKLVPITDEHGAKGITTREEKRAEIRSLWMSEPNLENIRNTAWGALNAVVQYSDHMRSYRSADSKALSILQGNNDNQRAYELLKAS